MITDQDLLYAAFCKDQLWQFVSFEEFRTAFKTYDDYNLSKKK